MKRAPMIIFLQGKDVQSVLGVSKTTAYRILVKMRRAYDKTSTQAVTLDELCEYERLDRAWVYARLFN